MSTELTSAQPIPPAEPIRVSWLYVPGDRPDRFDKAVASGADVVVIDWEDAVVAANKAAAREHTRHWLMHRTTRSPVEIRVNPVGSPDLRADLAALADCDGFDTVRLPKVQSAEDVAVAAAGLATEIGLFCVLESALGVEQAYSIARSPRVVRIGLGEADLQADLGVRGEDQLEWCRARVVVAARAAGLESPPMSVYRAIGDLTGLRESCRRGRDAGLLGRAAVHPRQVPVIREVFSPTVEEIAAARAVIAAVATAQADGRGGFVDQDGRFVDAAVVRSAWRILALGSPRPTPDGPDGESAPPPT